MEILVCIKQVPDTTEIRIDPETNTLIRTGVPSIMNPFDAYAVEQALQLKEMTDGRVTVVTMGPPQAKSILGDALAMGVDDAYLVTDRKFGGSDTLATSYILASVARKLGPFDVILCGKQAIDGDTGQVASLRWQSIWISLRSPMLAALRWTEKVSKRSENAPSTRRL